jgi:DNA modification methylase
VQLVIMHPPYHDIIKFSDDPRDLSNAPSVEVFLEGFGKAVDNTVPFLDKGRYLVLVIGDKYIKGDWIPLGFLTMNEVMKRGFSLKSIIVKNFEETSGKRNQKELWRYRALVGGFYIFKHEYVFLLRKQ